MNEKEEWIINYIQEHEHMKVVDILDEKFVNAFIKKIKAKYEVRMIGANKCRELSKLLSNMYKKGLLVRCAIGLKGGAWQDGFPKWVYCYEINE